MRLRIYDHAEELSIAMVRANTLLSPEKIAQRSFEIALCFAKISKEIEENQAQEELLAEQEAYYAGFRNSLPPITEDGTESALQQLADLKQEMELYDTFVEDNSEPIGYQPGPWPFPTSGSVRTPYDDNKHTPIHTSGYVQKVEGSEKKIGSYGGFEPLGFKD